MKNKREVSFIEGVFELIDGHVQDTQDFYQMLSADKIVLILVSWFENELNELVSYAESSGLGLISRLDAHHLEKTSGTPNFIRLFFSPRS